MSKSRQISETNQHLVEWNHTEWASHIYDFSTDDKHRSSSCRVAKTPIENPQPYWLEEPEDRIWVNLSHWTMSGEIPKMREPKRRSPEFHVSTLTGSLADLNNIYVGQTPSSTAKVTKINRHLGCCHCKKDSFRFKLAVYGKPNNSLPEMSMSWSLELVNTLNYMPKEIQVDGVRLLVILTGKGRFSALCLWAQCNLKGPKMFKGEAAE